MACGLGKKIFGDDEKMTKIEFLLMLLVISQFMMISIELAKMFFREGYLEDEDGGEDDEYK